ncbi:carboxypeptidase Q-like [Diorhabda sublineata]|uniref:carboxypeptidase Q-like n=1 Tax=Diorhabda sublineata TaxID=1163346 RepID=UPI0024E052DB|nr:carboxypeptidase Q-like [Diorhabda sublineata]
MILLTICLVTLASTTKAKSQECNLPSELVNEIHSYQETINKIIDATTKGRFKGQTYKELADFVDKFGARQAGGQILEQSIDYLLNLMQQDGYDLENVHGENVSVPHWIRGKQMAKMLQPRQTDIPVLTLGGSVSTPVEGVKAELLVVKDFDELNNKSELVKGRIIVFNNEWVQYGISVVYRSQGPIKAAQLGAVAVLIRSVTPFSLASLHTGQTNYDDNIKKIPAVCITIEDARMFQRYQDRNETIVLELNVQTENLDPTISRNTVAELTGTKHPEKIVLISGHLDSWDVGVGAMDDGGGAFISWYSLVVLKALGLRPKRTMRAVLWTAEEPGLIGVQAYNQTHQNELDNFIFVMESDEGTFTPLGIEYVAGIEGGCILEEILSLLSSINATTTKRSSQGVGSDITIWKDIIPTASLMNKNEKYFWFHHSSADTMDVLDPEALDKSVALWASVAYIIADLKKDFPRNLNESEYLKPTVTLL